MRIRHSTGPFDDKIELQMTPMIDIVFQLLIFFIFTFRIAGQEGDFSINMPPEGVPSGTDVNQIPPIEIRLEADANGVLRAITKGNESVASFAELQQEMIAEFGDDAGPGGRLNSAEVILDCDYRLRYEHVIEAMSAVSGYVNEEGAIIKLAEKVRFASPREP